jgi:hypothetical protein
MMGRQDRDQRQLFYEFNLDEMIPTDHLLRRIAESEFGTNRTSGVVRSSVANGGRADTPWIACFGRE